MTAPRALVRLAGDALPGSYSDRMLAYRNGDRVATVDCALSGSVSCTDPTLCDAPTLHLGGTRNRIGAAEASVASGRHADEPYVPVSQPSIVDASRTPDGHHELSSCTHVPHGSTVDQTESIIRQIERRAPQFRDVIIASSSATAIDMQRQNSN